MNEWCTNTWMDIVKLLDSDIYSGLKEEQVKENVVKYGRNEIEIPKIKGIFSRIIEEFSKLWILILFFISLMFLYNKELFYFCIILFIVILNVCINAFSQYKYDRSLKELKKIHSGTARVIRNGKIYEISSEEVVIGDIILVKAGDLVPADLRIVESENLKIKESVVTGEKYIIEKYETKIEGRELSLNEMKNVLFKSSFVIEGEGKGIVVAIGKNTQISNIISMLVEGKEEKYLLEKEIEKVTNIFSIIILIFSLTIMISNFFIKINLKDNILCTANMIFCSIPQSIIIVITLIAINIIKKFKDEGIYIKNLSVIETLAKTNLMCIDKLGTLTENSMNLKKIYTCNKIIDAEKFSLSVEEDCDVAINVQRVLNIGVLCNESEYIYDILKNRNNDLMEIGIIKYAAVNNIYKKELDEKNERILQLPFDKERRIMTTINRVDDNFRANIKGAVDVLLNICTHIMIDGIEREITEEDIKDIKNADIAMSTEGLNVIGTAYRNFNYEPTLKENIESNLVFVGLVGFLNPINKEALEKVKSCRNLGIKPIIITDENKLTALSTGKEMGILRRDDDILSGVEIDNMDEEEFKRSFKKIKIFSRINSKHKAVIMKYYKELGYITAITGSKFTDLPSLQIAKVGINYGKGEMLKKITDLSLEDVEFHNIISLLLKCRKIMNSLNKVILYIFTCSIMQFMLTAFCNVYLHKSPLRTSQIIWSNLFTVVASSLIIMCNCYYEDTTVPEKINKKILYNHKIFLFVNGLLGAAISYIPFIFKNSDALIYKQNWVFLSLNLNIVILLLNCINRKSLKNRKMLFLFITDFIVQIFVFIGSVMLSGNYFNIYSDWIYLLPITLWIIFSFVCKFLKVNE